MSKPSIDLDPFVAAVAKGDLSASDLIRILQSANSQGLKRAREGLFVLRS